MPTVTPCCAALYACALWQSGFVESFSSVKSEYIRERNLRAVRVAVLGAPASGKSLVSTHLAQAYCLPLVSCPRVTLGPSGQRYPMSWPSAQFTMMGHPCVLCALPLWTLC
jgi:hypothetical protein